VVGKSGIKMDHAKIEPSLIRIYFMMLDYCVHFWGCAITSYDLFKNILLHLVLSIISLYGVDSLFKNGGHPPPTPNFS
jgi:hypothetical protein